MSHEGFCYCYLYSNSAILLEQTLPFPIMLHISHSTPCLPPEYECLHIGIVFSSSWDDCNNQEKWKTKVMQNFGRQTRCILGHMQMMNRADTFLRHIWLAELRAKYCTPSLSVSCLSIVRNPSKITQTANIDWECSLCTALVPYLV